MMPGLSPLQQSRLQYAPSLPAVLRSLSSLVAQSRERSSAIDSSLMGLFPHTHSIAPIDFRRKEGVAHRPLQVGVVLSGGQASGGHNVITGLFDALKTLHPESQLIGFLNGPSGLIEDQGEVLSEEKLAFYRNQGGFDLIGSGRTKVETPEQFAQVQAMASRRNLDGIVIIGGDDSNTNAAFLAEYFVANNSSTCVVGVPKTIDGDLKNAAIEVSFGFDTACKTYSETIGSLLRDALSAGKYYFFVRLMGRSASHIALECALQTHPNYTIIGEEVAAKGMTVRQITDSLCDMICRRAEEGKNYGAILLPEGIVEFIPAFTGLIGKLNHLLAKGGATLAAFEKQQTAEERIAFITEHLQSEVKKGFIHLPRAFQEQLLLDRDPHGNVQVAKIETERFFISLVREELQRRKERGEYMGKFNAQPLYLGYEGRSCLPSNFDAQYTYALGHVAALLIDQGKTGYMSCVGDLSKPVEEWTIAGMPIVDMMILETREGKQKPVIAKALVDLEGAPFAFFAKHRKEWELQDDYHNPGPIQFSGPVEMSDEVTYTLRLERQT